MPTLILGLASAEKIFCPRLKISSLALPLALITLFSAASLSYTWFAPKRYTPRYNYQTVKEIMAMLPPDANVIMPIFMINEAKQGQIVRGFYQIPYEVDQQGDLTLDQDFVIIDTRSVPKSWQDSREYEGSQAVIEKMNDTGSFNKIFDDADLALYVRDETRY